MPLLPINFNSEVFADTIKKVDPRLESIVIGTFSLRLNLHALDIRKMDLLNVQDFTGCHAFEIALWLRLKDYVANSVISSMINFIEIRFKILAFHKALFEIFITKNSDFLGS